MYSEIYNINYTFYYALNLILSLSVQPWPGRHRNVRSAVQPSPKTDTSWRMFHCVFYNSGSSQNVEPGRCTYV